MSKYLLFPSEKGNNALIFRLTSSFKGYVTYLLVASSVNLSLLLLDCLQEMNINSTIHKKNLFFMMKLLKEKIMLLCC